MCIMSSEVAAYGWIGVGWWLQYGLVVCVVQLFHIMVLFAGVVLWNNVASLTFFCSGYVWLLKLHWLLVLQVAVLVPVLLFFLDYKVIFFLWGGGVVVMKLILSAQAFCIIALSALLSLSL